MKNNLKKYEDNKEEVEVMEQNKKKAIILTIVAVSCLLIVVFGAAYAYFQVLATNNVSTTNTQGQTDIMPKGILVTNITKLKINLDANLMSEENKGTTYYATESGTPVTTATEGSGKYVLATASLDKTGLVYDCTYSYRISATKPPKTINDGSDADVKVKVTGSNGYIKTYTLAQLLSGEQIYTGKIKELTYGTNQKIYIEAYVENTNTPQDDLSGNNFTFTLELVNNSFSCNVSNTTFAEKLIDSNELWQSGLEGDGYRFIGKGEYMCSYNNGTTTGTIGNFIGTCPETFDDLVLDENGQSETNNAPSNYICFGTTDKTECKNNEAKYMYRIIGVFEGSDGNQHLKLIKMHSIEDYAWHSSNSDVAWENSDIYTGLNGSYFLTNTTYDYMQNSTWLNKIEDWTWSAVNTKTYSDRGTDYGNSLPSQIYLHEMNRSSKTSTIGEWSTPTAKIGLMYVSDYTLSLGDSALSMTGNIYDNYTTLQNGWVSPLNNTYIFNEWTLSRYGSFSGDCYAWAVGSDGSVDYYIVTNSIGVRPVFYLTSNVAYKGGTGDYADPYIIAE